MIFGGRKGVVGLFICFISTIEHMKTKILIDDSGRKKNAA